MAEEKVMKGTEVKGTEVKGTETKEEKVVEPAEVKTLLKVEREKFVSTKDKKEYWSYFVKGTLKNKDVKVDLEAKDNGGYEVLELIFDGATEVYLNVKDEVMENERGVKSFYQTYEVFSTDADGIVYGYKVKPSRESDKALLNMLLTKLSISNS